MTHNSNLPQISHDLRSYISGISGLASLISENIAVYTKRQAAKGIRPDDGLQEATEFANMLAPYSHEAMQYVEDMLDTAQIETGKFILGEIEECDVEKLITRLLILNKGFTINQKINVEAEISPNLPKLKCDVRRLKQVLMNLITNAVKYSPEDSEVLIIAKFSNQKIQIEISDSGIGMGAEEITMALNGEGQNIDKSDLDKPIDSHGLGMPIVKQLMELMKGEMKIESEKGRGTKVILEFVCN